MKPVSLGRLPDWQREKGRSSNSGKAGETAGESVTKRSRLIGEAEYKRDGGSQVTKKEREASS